MSEALKFFLRQTSIFHAVYVKKNCVLQHPSISDEIHSRWIMESSCVPILSVFKRFNATQKHAELIHCSAYKSSGAIQIWYKFRNSQDDAEVFSQQAQEREELLRRQHRQQHNKLSDATIRKMFSNCIYLLLLNFPLNIFALFLSSYFKECG